MGADGTAPFFSRDGEWIGYFSIGKLWKISTAGRRAGPKFVSYPASARELAAGPRTARSCSAMDRDLSSAFRRTVAHPETSRRSMPNATKRVIGTRTFFPGAAGTIRDQSWWT